MYFVPAKTPFFIKVFLKNYIWSIPQDKDANALYLTFDDGPTPEITTWTLDRLKDFNAKATFFCIGSNIEKHPDIFKRIISEGHMIGNHTHSHLKGWRNTTIDYLSNIQQAQNIISEQNSSRESSKSKLFRPPYGQLTFKQGSALKKLGYKIIMWSVLSFDWEHKVSKETCYKNVIKSAKNGSIVVFHDSEKASKNLQYALPKVLKYYSEKGFLFKQIPE